MLRFSKKFNLLFVRDVTEYESTIFDAFISMQTFNHLLWNLGLLFFQVCSLLNHIKKLFYVSLGFLKDEINKEGVLTQFFKKK